MMDFDTLWSIADASWRAAILAGVILLVQWLLRRHLPASWRFGLWFLFFIRLCFIGGDSPFGSSRWSIFNWVPPADRVGPLLPRAVQPPMRTRSLQERMDAMQAEMIALDIDQEAERLRAARQKQLWQNAVVAIYLAGLSAILLRAGVATLLLHRILRRARLVGGAPATILAAAADTVDLRVPIRLFVSDAVASPALTGMMRPRLLVPPHVLDTFSPAELRMIFLHECVHAKREDVLWNHVLVLLTAIHWFNPVVWLLLPRIRADRELACDEAVLRRIGEAAIYGETLLKLVETSLPARPLVGAVGVVETRSFFKRRIRMIAAFRRTPAWLAMPALGLVILMAGATLTSAVTAVAQTTAKAAGTTLPAADADPQASAEEIALYAKLDERIKELHADAQSLEKVLAFLGDSAHINLVVNWAALQAAGIDRNSPVTLNLSNVQLRKGLQSVLQVVSSDGIASFTVEDNVLTVSTREELAGRNHTVTRVYNVRDLLDLPTALRNAAPKVDPVGGALFSPDASPTTGDAEAQMDLCDTVLTTVAPDSWREKGGTSSTLRLYKGMLIVTAPSNVQGEVYQLLQQIRAAAHSGRK